MKNLLTLLIILFATHRCLTQGVGIGTETPHTSAVLEVTSSTHGMLIPRMSTAQREMIATPATGLLVFDMTTSSFWFRNENSWVELVDSVNTLVKRNAVNEIYTGLNTNVGIGTSDPATKLHIQSEDPVNALQINHQGNALQAYVNSSGGWFGTKNNLPLSISAHEFLPAIRIGANGQVIIGDGNSQDIFHVSENARIEGYLNIQGGQNRPGIHPTGLPLYVTGDIESQSGGSEFRYYDGTQGIGLGYNTIYATGSNASQDLGMAARGSTGNLFFKTNNTNRLTILGNGYIGFGILPANKVDLHSGSTRSGTHPSNLPLYITGDIGHASNGFEIRTNNGTQGIGIGYNTIYGAGSGDENSLGLASKGENAQLFFNTNNNTRLRILGNGNAGFNISPNNTVDIVSGGSRTNTHPSNLPLYVTGILGAGSDGIEFRHNNGAEGIGFGYNTIYATGSNTDQHLGLSARGSMGELLFNTNNQQRVRILGNGNVIFHGNIGIGYIHVESPPVPINQFQTISHTCQCPEGTTILSGGYQVQDPGLVDVTTSKPLNAGTWIVTANSTSPTQKFLTVYAVCARIF